MNDPAIELLQTLIRNECVNDGTAASGFEERSVKTLTEIFGVDGHIFGPSEGRQSLVYRVGGTEPLSPSLALVPHLDVVPAVASDWSVDPFSAEIKDGFVYGRGALEMLNVVATIADYIKTNNITARRVWGAQSSRSIFLRSWPTRIRRWPGSRRQRSI